MSQLQASDDAGKFPSVEWARHEADWRRVWARLGALGDPLPVFADLRRRYTQPERAYHNWRHIEDGLRELLAVEHLADHQDAIRMAWYFHDAVYDTRASDRENVAQSARLAVERLRQAGLPDAVIGRIEGLIHVTHHTEPPAGTDAQLMADIDLSILGKPDAEFDRYERAIRAEYAWVADDVYRSVRAGILERFLQRPSIYSHPVFVEAYEVQARRNLRRSLAALAGP
jgi:predicted metal-dependent HD superfamily phosphohydrolase